jgi:hypothetical protein
VVRRKLPDIPSVVVIVFVFASFAFAFGSCLVLYCLVLLLDTACGGVGDDGTRKRIFCAILYKKQSFYPDRLGTNIGKTQKTTTISLQVGLPDFNYVSFMSVESQRLQWKAEGLPADQLSVENAIVIESAACTPYIIDPSTQAVSWLQQHMTAGEKTVNLVNQQDQKLSTDLELSVRKTPLFAPFYTTNNHFTKTGSGQT